MNCAPPTPFWASHQPSPLAQTLFDIAVPIVLVPDITYLNASQPGSGLLPIVNTMTMPDGSVRGQMKRFYIPSQAIATTVTWILSGKFAGFTKLKFDALGYSAVLEWDGAAWLLIGGNATLIA